MTLYEQLLQESNEETSASVKYMRLARELKNAGYINQGTMIEQIADDESRHANILSAMAHTISREEGKLEEPFGSCPSGEAKVVFDRMGQPLKIDTPFPETYGDWVDIAEKIKERMPEEGVKTIVNSLLQEISEGGPVGEEAKRWLLKKADDLEIH